MVYDAAWTVKRVIEELEKQDPEALVYFEGAYSGGLFKIDDIKDKGAVNAKGYKFVHLRGGLA